MNRFVHALAAGAFMFLVVVAFFHWFQLMVFFVAWLRDAGVPGWVGWAGIAGLIAFTLDLVWARENIAFTLDLGWVRKKKGA